MSKKIVKLIVAGAILAGSFGMGLAPRAANAACPPICCDPDCVSVRQCFGRGCSICSDVCEILGFRQASN
jgi:hypothetical protein